MSGTEFNPNIQWWICFYSYIWIPKAQPRKWANKQMDIKQYGTPYSKDMKKIPWDHSGREDISSTNVGRIWVLEKSFRVGRQKTKQERVCQPSYFASLGLRILTFKIRAWLVESPASVCLWKDWSPAILTKAPALVMLQMQSGTPDQSFHKTGIGLLK